MSNFMGNKKQQWESGEREKALCFFLTHLNFLCSRMPFSTIPFILLIFLMPYSLRDQPTLIPPNQPHIQEGEPFTRILFLFDASGSMTGNWQSGTKYQIAVEVLGGILDSLGIVENLETGLRVYGPKRDAGPDCEASYLMVPFAQNNGSTITRILKELIPSGSTPIAWSLEQTTRDFTICPGCRNIVILITDGLEACGGDPCAVSMRLQEEGIFLRPFIVGIGKNLRNHFDCLGVYYDATSEEDYRDALKTIVSTALKEATARILLLDQHGKPTKTGRHVILYNHITGRPVMDFMHALNSQGQADTLVLDPLIPYDIVVQTIPPVMKQSVQIEPGQHTDIEIEIPQGILAFADADSTVRSCIIRRAGSGEAIHIQRTDERAQLLAGQYDVTVLSMPRMNFSGVEVSPDAYTKIKLSSSEKVVLRHEKAINGELYLEMEDQLLWVCRLGGEPGNEILHLQPGNYLMVTQPRNAETMKETRKVPFVVESGSGTIMVK